MSETYIVEKRVNARAIVLIVLSVAAVVGAAFFFVVINIRNHRIRQLKAYVAENDFANATFLFRVIYEERPLDKTTLTEGIATYYKKMHYDEDPKIKAQSAENVVRYIRQLMLISFAVRRNPRYHRMLGEAYEARGFGYYSESLESYEAALAHGDTPIATSARAGHIAYLLGRYPDAIRHWDTALAYEEEHGTVALDDELRFLVGKAYAGNLEFLRAIDYQNAIAPRLTDETVILHNLIERGSLYFRQGLYPESENFYKKSLEMDDKNAEVYYNMGVLYKHMGRRRDAINYLTRARYLKHPLANDALRAL